MMCESGLLRAQTGLPHRLLLLSVLLVAVVMLMHPTPTGPACICLQEPSASTNPAADPASQDQCSASNAQCTD
jgi:hypothetical protein